MLCEYFNKKIKFLELLVGFVFLSFSLKLNLQFGKKSPKAQSEP